MSGVFNLGAGNVGGQNLGLGMPGEPMSGSATSVTECRVRQLSAGGWPGRLGQYRARQYGGNAMVSKTWNGQHRFGNTGTDRRPGSRQPPTGIGG